ncbi:MAG: hypothetical protein ACE5OZ_04325 [Candidatus Heimdallarchaeota archaeon]
MAAMPAKLEITHDGFVAFLTQMNFLKSGRAYFYIANWTRLLNFDPF